MESFGINIIIYERFKDDITMVAEALEKGSKLVDGKIVIDEEKKKKNDLLKKDDEISMEIIHEIAESIDDIVKFTVELPSKQENNKTSWGLAVPSSVKHKVNKAWLA